MRMQNKKTLHIVVGLLFVFLLNAVPVFAAETARLVVTDPAQAKQMLVDGNKRFVTGAAVNQDIGNAKREDLFKNGQTPFAAVVSCSDSRVPPELVFDQGLGDLFVVRVAGNILDPVGMGSIEFGAAVLGTRVILVLGHEDCGAVQATVNGAEVSENIDRLATLIQPAVKSVVDAKGANVVSSDIYETATDANVEYVVAQLKENAILKLLVAEKKLQIIGGKYLLASGEVKLFE